MMNIKKLKSTGAMVAIVCAVLLSGCSTKKVDDLDGTIVRTEDGRYFEIKKRIGATVYLSEIDFDNQPKKF